MPGPKFRHMDPSARRTDWHEDAMVHMEEALALFQSIGGSLEDDGQMDAGQAWASLAKELQPILERAKRLAK